MKIQIWGFLHEFISYPFHPFLRRNQFISVRINSVYPLARILQRNLFCRNADEQPNRANNMLTWYSAESSSKRRSWENEMQTNVLESRLDPSCLCHSWVFAPVSAHFLMESSINTSVSKFFVKSDDSWKWLKFFVFPCG